jgi:hypothetical protein
LTIQVGETSIMVRFGAMAAAPEISLERGGSTGGFFRAGCLFVGNGLSVIASLQEG